MQVSEEFVLTVNTILQALTGASHPQASLQINEGAVDSRQVKPGGLFVALPGENVDGHEYIADAFKRGAMCALIQKDIPLPFPVFDLRSSPIDPASPLPEPPFCLRVNNSLEALQKTAAYWRQQLDVRVIGITGSVGKSTTKELVAEVLSQRYPTVKNPGNLNNEIGLPLSLLQVKPGHNHAVLEMGFYVPGEIEFLCSIARPHVGVVTNIGTVHAERAGTKEDIARGKSELVQNLPPAPEGVAILNYDDPYVLPMAEKTQAQVFTYGLDPRADLWADGIVGMGLEGIRLQLHYQNEVLLLRVPLIGRHSVHTVLRAVAVGLVENLTWQEIINGMQQSHMQLRLVVVKAESGALILDDTYNASPESTMAALNLLEDMEGHKVAILGDMLELGIYEQSGHEMVGSRAAQICDVLYTVGPRALYIAQAARRSGLSDSQIHSFESTAQVIDAVQNQFTSGDIILIKGSHGMHMDQIVSAMERKND